MVGETVTLSTTGSAYPHSQSEDPFSGSPLNPSAPFRFTIVCWGQSCFNPLGLNPPLPPPLRPPPPQPSPSFLPFSLSPSPNPHILTFGICFLGKAGKTPALCPRIPGSRTTPPAKASRAPRRTPGTPATKAPGTATWAGTASTPGWCWRPRSSFARSRGGRSSRWRSSLLRRGSTTMTHTRKARTPVTPLPRGPSGRMCPPPLLRSLGWTDSRLLRKGNPSIPEQEKSGGFMSCNKGHFLMKTCILGVFLKPRWYYGIFLLLVSVPLSSTGKETEGLNVFATMSQVSISWKDFPPSDNHVFKAFVCSASVCSTRTGPPHREMSVALCDSPRQLAVTNYLEVEGDSDPSFSPFSFLWCEVTSQSLEDPRGWPHQKSGPYGTHNSHLQYFVTSVVFPALSQLLAVGEFLHPRKEAKPYPIPSGYHGGPFAAAL